MQAFPFPPSSFHHTREYVIRGAFALDYRGRLNGRGIGGIGVFLTESFRGSITRKLGTGFVDVLHVYEPTRDADNDS